MAAYAKPPHGVAFLHGRAARSGASNPRISPPVVCGFKTISRVVWIARKNGEGSRKKAEYPAQKSGIKKKTNAEYSGWNLPPCFCQSRCPAPSPQERSATRLKPQIPPSAPASSSTRRSTPARPTTSRPSSSPKACPAPVQPSVAGPRHKN